MKMFYEKDTDPNLIKNKKIVKNPKIIKYDIFKPLKPKKALIWIIKKKTVHERTEIVETDPNQ